MKTELRKIHSDYISVEFSQHHGEPIIAEIKIKTNMLNLDAAKLQLFQEVEIPETIQEFKELNNIDEAELVRWLNENYE